MQNILDQYDQKRTAYEEFTRKVESIVRDLLVANGIEIHSVTCRVKSRESLERKLSKPGKSYNSLGEITDVAGIRITTYFEDVVEKVAAVIEEEFDVDTDNSGDKKMLLDPDRFGYLSMHHVVGLSPRRANLAEYRRFACDYKVEIQTRSILQHAWAEIEHDLGYKTSLGIPKQIRRRFSRLAGLLELADEEFVGIRQALDEHKNRVEAELAAGVHELEIDRASIIGLIASSTTVKLIDQTIATRLRLNLKPLEEAICGHLASAFEHLGFRFIRELETALNDNRDAIVQLALRLAKPDAATSRAVSLYYLLLLQLAQCPTLEDMRQNLMHIGLSSSIDDAEVYALAIRNAWQVIQSQGVVVSRPDIVP